MKAIGLDLDKSKIGRWISTDHSGIERTVVIESNLEHLGALYHMVVGDDITVFAENYT